MSKLDIVSHSGPTPMASSNTSWDLLWQRLTRSANMLYENGDVHRAFEEYRRALHEAERLLALAENGAGPAEAAMLLVISHHNLAELASDMRQPDLVLHHYQTPFDTLLALAGLCWTPDALRQSCAANLKEATIALATHLQACGAPISTITDTIRKARFVATGTQDQPVPTRVS